jgi:hypothetical protein
MKRVLRESGKGQGIQGKLSNRDAKLVPVAASSVGRDLPNNARPPHTVGSAAPRPAGPRPALCGQTGVFIRFCGRFRLV